MKRSWLLPAALSALVACEPGATITAVDAVALSDIVTDDALTLTIDVQPKATNNVVNLATPAPVKVAILGYDGLDFADFDLNSVWFGPNRAPRLHLFTLDGQYSNHVQDVNGDLVDDLMFHFDASETGLTVGPNVKACLGITYAGQEYVACEWIRVISKNVH
jgi:hypothetical protein